MLDGFTIDGIRQGDAEVLVLEQFTHDRIIGDPGLVERDRRI